MGDKIFWNFDKGFLTGISGEKFGGQIGMKALAPRCPEPQISHEAMPPVTNHDKSCAKTSGPVHYRHETRFTTTH